MAILSAEDRQVRRLATGLALLSTGPFFWLLVLVCVPGLGARMVAAGFYCTGALALVCIIWLIVTVNGLIRQKSPDHELVNAVVRYTLLFGQFGLLWSVYRLTELRSGS